MKKTVLIGAGLILVFSLVAAAQMRPSPAMQMALDNMSKVMVDMPMNERAAYIGSHPAQHPYVSGAVEEDNL